MSFDQLGKYVIAGFAVDIDSQFSWYFYAIVTRSLYIFILGYHRFHASIYYIEHNMDSSLFK